MDRVRNTNQRAAAQIVPDALPQRRDREVLRRGKEDDLGWYGWMDGSAWEQERLCFQTNYKQTRQTSTSSCALLATSRPSSCPSPAALFFRRSTSSSAPGASSSKRAAASSTTPTYGAWVKCFAFPGSCGGCGWVVHPRPPPMSCRWLRRPCIRRPPGRGGRCGRSGSGSGSGGSG